jgi:mRNA interferase MazF
VTALPREGDVIEIDDVAVAGHEQRGRRPALVVSIPEFQQTGFAMVCPITSHGGAGRKRPNELEVPIPPGFAVTGVILSHHVRSIDLKARAASVIEHLPRATLLNVRARLKLFLGL